MANLAYQTELVERADCIHSEFEGFGETASDYDIRVENKKSGAGVRIQGDQPITKIVYWSIRTTLCPEAYITLEVPPGEAIEVGLQIYLLRYARSSSAQRSAASIAFCASGSITT